MNKFIFFFEEHSCEREGKTLTRGVHKVESCINCQSKIHMSFINDFCKRSWKSKIHNVTEMKSWLYLYYQEYFVVDKVESMVFHRHLIYHDL